MTAVGYVTHYAGPRVQTLTTPREFFNKLDDEFHFTMDGAADDTNALCPRYSTEKDRLPWNGQRVFCNPPWADIPPFLELALHSDLAVFLVPARVNARWFHRALDLGMRPRYFVGKLKFGDSRWNSPVDCLLLIQERYPRPIRSVLI